MSDSMPSTCEVRGQRRAFVLPVREPALCEPPREVARVHAGAAAWKSCDPGAAVSLCIWMRGLQRGDAPRRTPRRRPRTSAELRGAGRIQMVAALTAMIDEVDRWASK
jgi:hypothetical protein